MASTLAIGVLLLIGHDVADIAVSMLLWGASVAAPVGAVCGPAAGWFLRDRVPLGQGMRWAVAGAVLGGLAAPLLFHASRERSPLGAVVGCGLAVLALRFGAGASARVAGRPRSDTPAA